MNEKNWNISKDAIAQALAEGTSAEELAQAFTAQLNAALNERKGQTQKLEEAQVVVNFLLKYYPVMFEGLTVTVLLSALDDLKDILSPIAEAANNVASKLENANKGTEPKQKNSSVDLSLEDLLNIFSK